MTSEPSLDPHAVLGAVLIRSGDLAITRAEVRRWAGRFDAAFAARVRRRAALAALEDAVSDEDVEQAAADFRYARDLETADALVAWLADRGLSVEAWWEAVRRDLLEARFAGRPAPDAADEEEEEEEDDPDAQVADLAVSDLLAAPTDALARRVAVARESAQWAPPSGDASEAAWDERHDALEALWEAWRAAVLTRPALQAVVDRERLQWLVLDLVASSWPTEDAAREAASCVRYDGMALAEVARAAGAGASSSSRLLADVPDVLHDALLAAARGDLVGPIATPPDWTVLHVSDKRAPTLDEPLVRAAAEAAAEARAVAPLLARHVTLAGPRR